jgi:diacylglycerol kinase (ATP)
LKWNNFLAGVPEPTIMKILFVVNPRAGGTDHTDTISKVRDFIAERGFEIELLVTCGERDEEKLTGIIQSFKPDRVIAGGGDGTLRMVAKTLIPHNITFGILPLGSANGLATALGIKGDPLACLEKILGSTSVRKIDMLKFNDKHFCIHLADIGVNGLIVKKYEESGERGMIGYAKHLLTSIKETPMMKAFIRTPDGIFEKEGYLMAFSNANKYGTGIQISEGSVSDGKFEISNVAKIALDEAIKAGLTILNVFTDKNMFSDVISCTKAEIEIDRKAHFQIDGEYMGLIDHIKIEVLPATINLLV